MRSAIQDILPAKVRKSLTKFGRDLAIARKKRSLTVGMMCERTTVAKSTWLRVERGDPSVSLGIYAMALFSLGLGAPFGDLADQRSDEQGLMLDEERLPKRVRVKKGLETP